MIPIQDKPPVEWNVASKIFLKENFLPVEVCQNIITQDGQTVKKNINKYQTVFQTDFSSCLLGHGHWIHETLQPLWQEIIDYYQFDIDFVEAYELKRYQNSNFFGKHIDNYASLQCNLDRKLTMSIQLSSPQDYTGGNLEILNIRQPNSQGTIVVFPAFFSHRVCPVIDGVRWSLVTWAWGPYWK